MKFKQILNYNTAILISTVLLTSCSGEVLYVWDISDIIGLCILLLGLFAAIVAILIDYIKELSNKLRRRKHDT
ncbi:Uncharacterised protein [Sphingobacterium spiritivorum]|uniref:Lipoprotein n=1 Tax=Sphingobacterium spiritivorum TaxID=258 RepID=A0A380CSB3_SPHSI|nr:Uncharacterised protein [Sphingobacterium spiritivorum]